MVDFGLAVLAATVAWFVTAGVAFFNPPVAKIYATEEEHPAVKVLPQSPATIGKILSAVLVQCLMWAGVYVMIKPGLGDDPVRAGLVFGGLICLVKIVPRDIDRVLLTTYPPKRLTIEFVVGVVCAFVVGFAFAYLL